MSQTRESPAQELVRLTSVIRNGLKALKRHGLAVGNALLEIRDRRLYLEASYSSLATYVRDTFDLSESRLYQLIAWAKLPSSTIVENEAQAREVAKATPEQQQQLMSMVGEEGATAARFRHYLDAMGDDDRMAKLQEAKNRAGSAATEPTPEEALDDIESQILSLRRKIRRKLPHKAEAVDKILDSLVRELRA